MGLFGAGLLALVACVSCMSARQSGEKHSLSAARMLNLPSCAYSGSRPRDPVYRYLNSSGVPPRTVAAS